MDEALSEPTISIGTQTDDSDDPTDDAEKAPMLIGISPPHGRDSTDASTSNSGQNIAIKVRKSVTEFLIDTHNFVDEETA